MKYEVRLDYWVNGNGFTHSETFDWLDKYSTARDYIDELDPPLIMSPSDRDDAIEVCIVDEEGNVLDSAWIEKEVPTTKDGYKIRQDMWVYDSDGVYVIEAIDCYDITLREVTNDEGLFPEFGERRYLTHKEIHNLSHRI